MTSITTAIHIERAVDEVFDFVTTPGNWPQWHPSSLQVTGATDHSLVVGEQVTEAFRVAWQRGQVVWTVDERKSPTHWVIDGQIIGRNLGGTITYTLSPDGDGTLFQREFVYSTPRPYHVILDKVIGRRRVQYESDLASLRLKSLLEKGKVENSFGASSYYFLDEWFIPAAAIEVWPYIAKGSEYPLWWGMVYDKVELLSNTNESQVGQQGESYGESQGESYGEPYCAPQVGDKAAVSAHGRLPYHIHFTTEITAVEPLRLLALKATGNLNGQGTWRLTPIKGGTRVTFEWIVQADKLLLRMLSPLVKPLLADNHRWTMRQGEAALRSKLQGRQ